MAASMPDAAPKQILIIDRDAAAVEPLRANLCDAGFAVRTLADASAAVATLTQRPPHLIIVEWTSPGFAAREVISIALRVRVPHEIRMILLSALSSEPDVVAGFDLGIDDYIAKPFSVREVVARVCAVLRRKIREHRAVISCDDLTLDTLANRATAHGQLLVLRAVEYRILEFLMSHPGKTFNRAQILKQVWGSDREVEERTIDVNVQRLRKTLAGPGYESHIQTVRGFGYRFSHPGGE